MSVTGESSYTVTNPYNDEAVAEFVFASPADVETALGKLHAGKKTQQNLSPFERADILNRLATLMDEHAEELAWTITLEMGKTIRESQVEIQRARNTILASAAEARRIYGENLPADAYPPRRDRTGMVHWRPIGLVLAITPFNFPINIAAHKVGPAFAAGNTILFKPGPQNYLSATLWTELCYLAGFPEDVLQMSPTDVPGVQLAVEHPYTNCINFTGGVAAGKAIAARAGYKKLLLELGGNDPLILMPDGDPAAAAATAIQQRFGTSGQRCTAAKRVFIHADIYEAFRDALLEQTQKLKVGDPGKNKTDVGPLVNSQAADQVMARIAAAIEGGATALIGNRREGNIVYPTILENVSDDAELVCDETFGPVIPLRSFRKLDEVVEIINGSPFGLQAGIFTNDLKLVQQLFEDLDVGTLAVNEGPGFRAEHFPFGGVKDSGTGREGVAYAIREMSIHKTLVI